MKKRIITLLFITLILINFTSAVTVVQNNPEPEKKTGFAGAFESMMTFIKSPIFWGGVVILVFIVILGVIIFFVVKWLISFFKKQNDIFYLMKNQRIQLAKIHRRYAAPHWFKVNKNLPIRLAHIDENNKPFISRPIGFYRGDYETHEGNIFIACNLEGKKKWFFFPETDLIVIPNKDEIKITTRNEDGRISKEIKFNMPDSKEIVKFNETEVLIFAESLSATGNFLIPVLKDKNGQIMNLAAPTYATLQNVVIEDYLYTQTSAWGVLAKEAMEINPKVRAIQKVGDNNQDVDIPQGEQKI